MHEIILNIIVLVIYLGYVLLEGFREGYYWHYKMMADHKSNFEIHPYFSVQRGMVMVIITMFLSYMNGNLIITLPLLLSLMAMFSFIHNGMYYIIRNRLKSDVYVKRWWDQSTTSTAHFTKFMEPKYRTLYFLIGLVTYIQIIIR